MATALLLPAMAVPGMLKYLQILLLSLVLTTAVHGQTNALANDSAKSNKRQGEYIAKEIAGSLGGGLIFGIIGGRIGTALTPPCNNSSFCIISNEQIAGLSLGYAIGTAVGATLVGLINGKRGRFIYSLAGVGAASLCAFGLYIVTDAKLAGYPLFILPVAGAVLGYELDVKNRGKVTGVTIRLHSGDFRLTYSF